MAWATFEPSGLTLIAPSATVPSALRTLGSMSTRPSSCGASITQRTAWACRPELRGWTLGQLRQAGLAARTGSG